jgi:hypothetical protein
MRSISANSSASPSGSITRAALAELGIVLSRE